MLLAAQTKNNRGPYSSKANFIAQLIESTNAKFGVANVDILGKTKAAVTLARSNVGREDQSSPLASASGSIDDGL